MNTNLFVGQYLQGQAVASVSPNTSLALDLVELQEVLLQKLPAQSDQLSDSHFSWPNHPHLCSPLRRFTVDDDEYLVMTCPGTLSLDKYLKQFGILDELRASKFFFQICLAMSHLNRHGLSLRQINSENVIVTPGFNVALFDIESQRNESGFLTQEQLKDFGTMILRMLKGEKAFTEEEMYHLCFATRSEECLKETVSDELRCLLKTLFFGKTKRISIDDLLNCYWILNNRSIFSVLSPSTNALIRDYKGYFSATFQQRPRVETRSESSFKRFVKLLRRPRRETEEEEEEGFMKRINARKDCIRSQT